MTSNSIKLEYGLLTTFASQELEGESYFPLGIFINISERQLFFRSRIDEYLKIYRSDLDRLTKDNVRLKNFISSGYSTKKLLEEIISKKLFPIFNLLEDEKLCIQKIFGLKGKDYLSALTKDILENDYQKYTMEISKVFDEYIKKKYIEELRALFFLFIDKDDDKELFRITNYLIHFINWNNSFYNYYDNSLEIISGVIRKIENHLSQELLTNIKAYRAYYSQVNVITRFLEKRENGRITALSILDWNTDIKDILTRQFISFFGKSKTLEYIESLEKILLTELEK